jgi:hypothetical protein
MSEAPDTPLTLPLTGIQAAGRFPAPESTPPIPAAPHIRGKIRSTCPL